jgi:hypothetical protein
MLASLLMQYKSRGVSVDNKELSGKCPHVAPVMATSCFGRWKRRLYSKSGFYVTAFSFLNLP